MAASDLRKRMRTEIDAIPFIDTHEHLTRPAERYKGTVDFHTLFAHYASSDLISAGMPWEDLCTLHDQNVPLSKRWKLFKPFWQAIHNTCYARALRIAIRDIYGIDDITDATYKKLSDAMQAKNKKGFYQKVLRDMANIEVGVMCVGEPIPKEDEDLFVGSLWINDQFLLRKRGDVRRECNAIGRSSYRLDDLVDRINQRMAWAVEVGMVSTKISMAYERTLLVGDPSRTEAEDVLARVRLSDGQLSHEEAKPLCDYLIHEAVRACGEVGLPVQIHTGIHEGNGNWISNSDPKGLTRLFMDHPGTKFDLFHGSYPFTSSLAVLAKNFPNVHPDMCWLHCISQSISFKLLEELIDTVPMNKILAFGGDYIFPEGSYGHAVMARETITRVLCKKVEEGYFTEDEALTCARWVMHDAADRLFGISDRRKKRAPRKKAAKKRKR